MQVKKFEAKSMKEALGMVKRELGPEAIILSAKDIGKTFGLMGDPSVEVTAAISETVLRKKIMAEKKIRSQDVEDFRQSPASNQKRFINKVYDRAVAKSNPAIPSRSRRYIDIEDEPISQLTTTAPVTVPIAAPAKSNVSNIEDIKSTQLALKKAAESQEVKALKQEVSRLNKVISEFQTMPQNFISVHPGAEKGVSYEFSSIFEKLYASGMDEDIILDLIDTAKREIPAEELRKKPLIDAWMARQILQTTEVVEKPVQNFIQVFMGASGQGKTSSLVKLAGELVVNQGKRIALITADTMKVGAAEQLKIFAQILNVPFATVRGPEDWRYIMEELGDLDHLLLDFPAVQINEMKDIDFAKSLLPPTDVSRSTHLVVAATSRNKTVEEMMRSFRIINVDDVIFTKLDEAAQHGIIYNFQKKYGIPVHSFGTGQNLPEDYEFATKERILDLLFRLTKVKTERGA